MVTEFSQWLSAIETQDFTLVNPMDEGMIEAAINVLQPKSSDLILQGTFHTHNSKLQSILLQRSCQSG